MSQIIRERWKLLLCLTVLCFALLFAIVATFGPHSQATAVQPSAPGQPELAPEQMEAIRLEWQNVDRLREEAGYGDAVLRAMTLTGEVCELTYVAALTWTRQNTAALNGIDRQIVEVQAELRGLNRKVAVGPKDQAVTVRVPEAMRELASLQKQRRALLEGLKTAMEDQLDQASIAVASRVRQNAGLPAPYDALALSSEQSQQLRSQLDLYARQMAAMADEQARERASIEHKNALRRILGTGYEADLAHHRHSAGTSAVAATRAKLIPPANDQEIPVPEELGHQ